MDKHRKNVFLYQYSIENQFGIKIIITHNTSSSIQIHWHFSSIHGKINYFNESRKSQEIQYTIYVLLKQYYHQCVEEGQRSWLQWYLTLDDFQGYFYPMLGIKILTNEWVYEFRIWVKCRIHFNIKKLFAVQHYLSLVFFGHCCRTTLDFSYIKRWRTHRQTRWPALHAVFLTALVGGHGLVGRRSTGLWAEGILGEFLKKKITLWIPHMQKNIPKSSFLLLLINSLFGSSSTNTPIQITDLHRGVLCQVQLWLNTYCMTCLWHHMTQKIISYCTALCHP